jgi:hypothetical protein
MHLSPGFFDAGADLSSKQTDFVQQPGFLPSDRVKSVTDWVKSEADLVKSETDWVNSVADLIKSEPNWVKLVTD